MKYFAFGAPAIPADFKYPESFLLFCATTEEQDIVPWYIFDDAENAIFWLETVREQYPDRNVIPFARDASLGDELACFDGNDVSGNPSVYYVHCFADPGWEDRGQVADFSEWVKLAQEDHNEFVNDDVESENS